MKILLRRLATPGLLAISLAFLSAPSTLAQTSVINVPPPQVQDYWVSITRQSGGTLVFDGYAPSAAVRDALGENANADVSYLKLGSGAPNTYQAATTFGLAALQGLSEGRFAMRDGVVTLSGIAATQADFLTLTGPNAPKPPAGLILAKAEISAPPVSRYEFDLRKQANGNVIVSGYVPSPEIEAKILEDVGTRSSSTLRFGSGEPMNFASSLEKALQIFAQLQEGEIRLENNAWLIAGTPKTSEAAAAIRTSFTDERLAENGWSVSLSQPAAAAPVFAWSLEKSATGAVTMSGSAPTEAFQRVFASRLGENLSDQSTVSDNAPEGFITQALVAADSLNLLSSGTVSYDGTKWSITGKAKTAGGGAQVAQALAASEADWQIAVIDPVAVEAETPAAAEEPPTAVAAETSAQPAPAAEEPATTPSPDPTRSAGAPATAVSRPEDLEACRTTLSQLSAQNGILFRSGAAILADGTEAILQAMAAAANQCPSAALNVEGHTDSDGDATANLALSVARAEAVINALIALGVDPSRLYAIGYGEAQPIADNGTAAGKAQNRRIVVSVRDE